MTLQWFLKILISALVIAGVSELAKRNSLLAALLAALPLTSLLAILWLYFETRDPYRVAELCQAIFWAVLPSLVFFIAMPFLLKRGWGFFASLAVSALSTLIVYGIYYRMLRLFRINL